MKSQSNPFKGHIETLLDENNVTAEAITFKTNIKQLQSSLVNATIMTQERKGVSKQISFSEIAIVNPKLCSEGDYRQTHYKIQRVGAEQQGQCRAFYKEICPYVMESVLTKDRDNNVIFIPARAKVSRGIIEVLYLLRCSLMHGEVYPNNSAMEVYKYAYYVLTLVLKKLV